MGERCGVVLMMIAAVSDCDLGIRYRPRVGGNVQVTPEISGSKQVLGCRSGSLMRRQTSPQTGCCPCTMRCATTLARTPGSCSSACKQPTRGERICWQRPLMSPSIWPQPRCPSLRPRVASGLHISIEYTLLVVFALGISVSVSSSFQDWRPTILSVFGAA